MLTMKRVLVVLLTVNLVVGVLNIKAIAANAFPLPSFLKFNSNTVAKTGPNAPVGEALVADGTGKTAWAKVKGTDLDSGQVSDSVPLAPAGEALVADGAGKAAWAKFKGSDLDSGQASNAMLLTADGNGGTFWGPSNASQPFQKAIVSVSIQLPLLPASGIDLNGPVSFNSEIINVGNLHDKTTNPSRITCAVPGTYSITATGFARSSLPNVSRAILENVSIYINGKALQISSLSSYGSASVTGVALLKQGDYVELYYYGYGTDLSKLFRPAFDNGCEFTLAMTQIP